MLTMRSKNKGRFSYPGYVPNYESMYADKQFWDSHKIKTLFQQTNEVISNFGLRSTQVFVGELGISRDIQGAQQYLHEMLQNCFENKWSVCLYAFREADWNIMDYELGIDINNTLRDLKNPLMQEILYFLKR